MTRRALSLLEGNDEVAEAVDLLRAWVGDGAHRVDVDQDGRYEHEAAMALFDAWYDPMIDAVLDEIAGLPVPQGRDDGNRRGHLGSAFQGGYYRWLQKSFRQTLGETPGSPFDEIACGDGSSASCADVLATSLEAALEVVRARLGGDRRRRGDDRSDRLAEPPDVPTGRAGAAGARLVATRSTEARRGRTQRGLGVSVPRG